MSQRWIPFCLLACACGGDDDPPAEPDAAVVNVDAATPADAPPVACAVPESHGDLAGLAPVAVLLPQDPSDPAGPKLIQIDTQLNEDPARDVLVIQLWDGAGPFAGGEVATLDAHPLTGADADFTTCGACVVIFADLDTMDRPSQVYVANGGTISLTSVEGDVTGSLADVTLRHVDLPIGGPQADNPSGCETAIASFAFSTPLTMP